MNNDWKETLVAVMAAASCGLPDGYRLRLDIERHGYSARLVLPDGIVADVDRETIVDEIEGLVALAIRLAD